MPQSREIPNLAQMRPSTGTTHSHLASLEESRDRHSPTVDLTQIDPRHFLPPWMHRHYTWGRHNSFRKKQRRTSQHSACISTSADSYIIFPNLLDSILPGSQSLARLTLSQVPLLQISTLPKILFPSLERLVLSFSWDADGKGPGVARLVGGKRDLSVKATRVTLTFLYHLVP